MKKHFTLICFLQESPNLLRFSLLIRFINTNTSEAWNHLYPRTYHLYKTDVVYLSAPKYTWFTQLNCKMWGSCLIRIDVDNFGLIAELSFAKKENLWTHNVQKFSTPFLPNNDQRYLSIPAKQPLCFLEVLLSACSVWSAANKYKYWHPICSVISKILGTITSQKIPNPNGKSKCSSGMYISFLQKCFNSIPEKQLSRITASFWLLTHG